MKVNNFQFLRIQALGAADADLDLVRNMGDD